MLEPALSDCIEPTPNAALPFSCILLMNDDEALTVSEPITSKFPLTSDTDPAPGATTV